MPQGSVYPGAGSIRADSPADASEIQDTLRHCCIYKRAISTESIRHIAGADAAYAGDRVCAAVVVLTFPGLSIVEKACAIQKVTFPYIPGLLSFREGPAVLDAFFRLKTAPDVLIVNGHGAAHPKRFGIASHLGLILEIPSIGIAQRLLTGSAGFPGTQRGSVQPVLDRCGVIGMAVRTKEGSKPVFVSAGHKTDLDQAVEVALRTTAGHRITEPVWHADRVSRGCMAKNAVTG